MASHGDRTGRDTLDALLQRLGDVEKDVHLLKGGRRVSFDRGDTAAFVADEGAFEGQTLIQYNTELPWYFSNGEWRPFTSGIQLNSATEWFEVAATSIAGSTVTQLTWSYLSGPTLLDMTDPTQPHVLKAGVYAIDLVSIAAGATTTNEYTLEGNMVQAAYTASIFGQRVYSASLASGLEASLSISGVMAVADSFLVKISNHDNAARDFTCPSVRVTKILEIT